MATVSYDSKLLIPAPLYSVSQALNRAGDGTPIGVQYSVTINGTLVAHRGSPDSGGSFGGNDDESFATDAEKFDALQKKKNQIKNLFKDDGKIFEISGGGSAFTCYPKIESVNFSEGVNVEKAEYSITLTAYEATGAGVDELYPTIDSLLKFNLSSVSESFNITNEIDYDAEGVEITNYTVSHTVNAQAIKSYVEGDDPLPGTLTTPAYQNARGACQAILANTVDDHYAEFLGNSTHSDLADSLTDYSIVDRITVDNADYYNGSYSITKNLKYVKNLGEYPVHHEYTVESSKNLPKHDGALGYQNTYTVAGTITGKKSDSATKYVNAKGFYDDNIKQESNYTAIIDIILIALDEVALSNLSTANASPLSKRTTHNKRQGVITYNFTFKENSIDAFTAADAYFADFDITANEKHDDNKIAIIPILGRAKGPIIQNLNTTNLLQRTINGSFLLKNNSTAEDQGNPYKWDDINTIREKAIDVIKKQPAKLLDGTQGTDWFVTEWSDSLDIFKGIFTINLTIAHVRAGDTNDVTGTDWEQN